MPTINGTSGNDTLVSNPALDDMQGLAGDDLYIIYSGDDHPAAEINDSAGYDTIEFQRNAAGTLTLYAGHRDRACQDRHGNAKRRRGQY
jgi:hypothetical protein